MTSRRRSRRFSELLLTEAVLFLAALIAAFLMLGAYEQWSWSSAEDHETLVEYCSECHSSDRPRQYVKSPDQWRMTVGRMAGRAKIPIDDADIKIIADFMIRQRSNDPVNAFYGRCGRCHSASVLDPYLGLDSRAMELMVRRHIVEHNYAVNVWEGDMILRFLTEHKNNRSPAVVAGSGDGQYLIEDRCRACHTISFVYRTMLHDGKDAEAWSSIVRRMRDKAPDMILEEDVQPILNQIGLMKSREIQNQVPAPR